jgi:hypothetical protein
MSRVSVSTNLLKQGKLSTAFDRTLQTLVPPARLQRIINITPLTRILLLNDLRFPAWNLDGMHSSSEKLRYSWRVVSTLGLLAGTVAWGVTRVFPRFLGLPEASTSHGAAIGEFLKQAAYNFGNFYWGASVTALALNKGMINRAPYARENALVVGCCLGALLPELIPLPLFGTRDLNDIPAGLLGVMLVYCFSISRKK